MYFSKFQRLGSLPSKPQCIWYLARALGCSHPCTRHDCPIIMGIQISHWGSYPVLCMYARKWNCQIIWELLQIVCWTNVLSVCPLSSIILCPPSAMDRVQFLHTLAHTGYLFTYFLVAFIGMVVRWHLEVTLDVFVCACWLTISVALWRKVFSSLLSILKLVFLLMDYLHILDVINFSNLWYTNISPFLRLLLFFSPLIYRTFLKIHLFVFYVYECLPAYICIPHMCDAQNF